MAKHYPRREKCSPACSEGHTYKDRYCAQSTYQLGFLRGIVGDDLLKPSRIVLDEADQWLGLSGAPDCCGEASPNYRQLVEDFVKPVLYSDMADSDKIRILYQCMVGNA